MSAQVYRLYQATLDPAPDVQGHVNWTGRITTGEQTLQQVTAGFVGSPEFTAAFPLDASAAAVPERAERGHAGCRRPCPLDR